MNDARNGVAILALSDRDIPLQLTYAALDVRGHSWCIENLKLVQKGKAGSATALAELLEVFSDGEIGADEVMAGAVADLPLMTTMAALWRAWELAQYGPAGRSAEEAPENPRKQRSSSLWMWWRSLFGRR